MITERIHLTATFRDGKGRERQRRTVIITGKRDLAAFADVLLKEAAQARAAGNERNADRLDRLSRQVRNSRRFTMDVPMDANFSKDSRPNAARDNSSTNAVTTPTAEAEPTRKDAGAGA